MNVIVSIIIAFFIALQILNQLGVSATQHKNATTEAVNKH